MVLSVERHHHHADVVEVGWGCDEGARTSTDMAWRSIDHAVSKIERRASRCQGKLRRFDQPKPVATVLLHVGARRAPSTGTATKLVRSRSLTPTR